ncbi:MAG: glycosyltransferase [Candidatus Moraniibacteriota bacterium]
MQLNKFACINKKHTFVVLAYGKSQYLEDCIKSVLEQSIDGNVVIATSTRNSFIENMARKYGLELIENMDSEKGIAQDFEFALLCSKTYFVTIAHQDDIYEKSYLENVLGKMDETTLIAFTNYAEIRNDKEGAINLNLFIKNILLFPLKFKMLQKRRFFKRACLAFGNPICCPSVTFNRQLVTVPLFISNFRSNMDWNAWEKLSNNIGAFSYVQKKLLWHRIHEDSTTSEMINENKRSAEDYEMLKLFWPQPIAKMITKIYKNSEKNNR